MLKLRVYNIILFKWKRVVCFLNFIFSTNLFGQIMLPCSRVFFEEICKLSEANLKQWVVFSEDLKHFNHCFGITTGPPHIANLLDQRGVDSIVSNSHVLEHRLKLLLQSIADRNLLHLTLWNLVWGRVYLTFFKWLNGVREGASLAYVANFIPE